MVIENALLQQICKGNSEVSDIPTNHFLDPVNRQICEIALKLGDITFNSVRSAINQDNRILYKGRLHDRLNEVEKEIYGYYPEMVDELQDIWKIHRTKQTAQKLEKLGTDACTLEDARIYVDELQSLLSYGKDTEDLIEFEKEQETILSKEPEDVSAYHLHITHPILNDIFDKYLIPRLYVISGWSSMGKNILADNLVYDLCLKYPGLYFTFDNSAEETIMAILSIGAGIHYKRLEAREIDNYEKDKLEKRKKIKDHLFICERRMTAKQIRQTIETAIKKYNIKFAIIDYFTNIRLPYGRDVVRQYEEATLILKSCCNDYKITMLVISQLNDDGEVKWCRGLFQEAYHLIKMNGKREENFRQVLIDKYKKGELRQVNIEYNASLGEICYAKKEGQYV